MIQETPTIFNSIEPQPENVGGNTIFNFRCRPKTQDHSPFNRLGGA